MVESNFGIVSLIPIIVVVVLAIVTKRVIEPLLFGTLIGFIILSGTSFFGDWVQGIMATIVDPDTMWVLVIVALLGVLILMFNRSNALVALRDVVLKYVKTKRGSLLATFFLGIVVFIDEYMNAILVGNTMKKLTDKFKVPREVLAYITNTTGAPVVVLLPLTGWAMFVMGLYAVNDVTHNGSTFLAYLKTIPFMFYAIVSLFLVLLFIYRKIPMTNYVKQAFERAEKGHLFPEIIDNNEKKHDEIASADELDKQTEINDFSGPKPRMLNFILPLIMLVVGTILFDMDMLIGMIFAVVTCFVLYLLNKTMNYKELFSTFISGVEQMVFLIIFIVFLFLLVGVNGQLGTIEYVFNATEPYISGSILPFMTLLVVALLSFTTGSFFGTMAIALPLIIPFVEYSGANIYLALGAMVSGAVFGSHVCFFGDAVTLTSSSTEVRNIDQLKVSLPYALAALLISAVLYLILGFII